MKVLVIGSGAREHAIAYTLLKGASVEEVTVAPGNPGMELDGIRTLSLNPSNQAALIDFVRNNDYDWVFVGPEVPLIEGIVVRWPRPAPRRSDRARRPRRSGGLEGSQASDGTPQHSHGRIPHLRRS